MKFGGNKRLLKELEKVRLEVLILETFILVLMGSGIKNSWKEFDHLKNIDQKYYCSDYYDCR